MAVVRHELTEADSGRTLPCRVIFVFSTADQKVARKNREKSVAKLRSGLEQIARSVEEGRRCTDPTSIARRVAKLFGQRQAAAYFRYEMVPLSKKERAQLPRPKRGCRRPGYRFQFTYDQAAADRDAAYDGYSALVTTAPREQSADLVFTKYKQQGYSELANHEFKTPLAVHPVFLKSPRRVEALVFLMMIALTAYFLLQRMYRQSLPATATPQERSHHDPNAAAGVLQLHVDHSSQPPGPRSTTDPAHHSAARNPPTIGLRHSRSNPLPSSYRGLRSVRSPRPRVATFARLRNMGLAGRW